MEEFGGADPAADAFCHKASVHDPVPLPVIRDDHCAQHAPRMCHADCERFLGFQAQINFLGNVISSAIDGSTGRTSFAIRDNE